MLHSRWVTAALLAALPLLGTPPGRALAADCNGNGIDDLVDVGSNPDCNNNLIPDECDHLPLHFGLEESGHHSLGWDGLHPLFCAVDLEGDADLDLVTSNELSGVFTLHLNRGDGTFEQVSGGAESRAGTTLGAGDFDGDGDADLVTTPIPSISAVIIKNVGGTALVGSAAIQVGNAARIAAIKDMDGDGDLDFIATSDRGVMVPLNDGEGSFPRILDLFNEPASSAVADDFNGDGRLDILAFVGEQDFDDIRRFALRLGDAEGAFREEVTLVRTGDLATGLSAADLNADGAMDLAYISLRNGYLEFFFNPMNEWRNDTRVFRTHQGTPETLGVWDADADGDQDLVVGATLAGDGTRSCKLHFLLNAGTEAGGFHPPPVQFFSRDCDRAETVPGDADGDGAVDVLASTWDFPVRQDLWVFEAAMVARANDCNENSVPDDCEDCNLNGLADQCDLESGRSRDVDRNGVPDDCERPLSFTLGFSEAEILERTDTQVRFKVFVLLDTVVRDVEAGGALGWSLYAAAEGGEVVAATTAGTAADLVANGGYRRQEWGAYTSILEVPRDPDCRGRRNVVLSSVFLSLEEEAWLDPEAGPHPILALEVEAPIDPAGSCSSKLTFPIGLKCVADEPYGPRIDARFGYPAPGLVEATFQTCANFRRGDSNSDGRVDISDAIRIFMYLFLGATEPACLDTADADDGGSVDISDGLLILNDFFRPGTAISAPGPFDCGVDPTPDSLGCSDYLFCP